jgi:hypothetical protein
VRVFVSAKLSEGFKNLTFVGNGSLQICPSATNSDKHFIKMPGSRRSIPAGFDVGGNHRAEFQDPSAGRFITKIDPAFGQHFSISRKLNGKRK